MTRTSTLATLFLCFLSTLVLAQDAVIEQGKNNPATGKPYASSNDQEELPAFHWQVKKASFNSDVVDICAMQYLEDIIFLSSRKNSVTEDNWQEAKDYDIYAFASDGSREEVVPFDTGINSPSKEGPFTFSEEGDVMFFTRNLPAKARQSKSTGKTETMIIMTCELDRSGEWSFPKPFQYNSKHFGVGHPTLSSDGTELYFISDDPAGYGGYDLYVCYLEPNKGWTQPENLGPEVNTAGDEMFPHVLDDGTLFFASNGLQGLGGFDLYKCEYTKGQLSTPIHMDAPINSPQDDFAITYKDGNTSGYFSSNRTEDGGGTNIYAFVSTPMEYPTAHGIVMDAASDMPITKKDVSLYDDEGLLIETVKTNTRGVFSFTLRDPEKNYKVKVEGDETLMDYESPALSLGSKEDIDYGTIGMTEAYAYALEGVALDSKTGVGIEGIKTLLIDRATGEVVTYHTQADGSIQMKLEENSEYDLKFEKEGYFAKTASFSTKEKEAMAFNLSEVTDMKFDAISLDEGIRIDNIFFDYMSSFLSNPSKKELDGVVNMLMDNPEIKIEVGSHSDQRGEAKFNMWLSERRAKSVRQYIIDGGIAADRVTAKGYGESQLLRDCGGSCSDADYEINRRTEFKVLQP